MFKSNLIAIYCLCLFCCSANAQYDFFWSDQPLNSGAINDDLLVSTTGQQGSLFLYYTTNGPTDADLRIGVLMNIAVSKPGVIRFTQAEVFNFEINVTGQPVGSRWPGDQHKGDVQDNFICRWGALNSIAGEGIHESNTGPVFFDMGYDENAGAFLLGRIDYDIVAECGADSVGINISIDEGQIAYFDGCINQPLPQVGQATIHFVSLFLLGDVNVDGERNLLDVQPFVNLIVNEVFTEEADINKDGNVDLLDVGPFIDLLLGSDPFEFECKDNSMGEPTGKCLIGDVNQDGEINLFDDAALLQQVAAGEYMCEADINEDGIVNVTDIACWVDLIFDL